MPTRFLGILVVLIVVGFGSLGLRADGGKSVIESAPLSWIPNMSNRRVVKVLELPDSLALRRDDGKHVDLGYYYHRLWGGEWVGYIDSHRAFVPLNEDALKALLVLGGVDKMPAVPERPLMFDRVLVGGIILLILGGWVHSKVFGSRGTASSRRAKPKRKKTDEREVDWESVDAQIQAEANAIGQSGNASGSQGPRSAGFGRRRK